MLAKYQFSLRACLVVVTLVALFLALATAVLRGRMPKLLRNVDYSKVKDIVWLRSLVPSGAREITALFTAGQPAYSRFRMSAEEFQAWMASEGFPDPAYEGTLILKESAMGDDGHLLPYGTVIKNAQAWDQTWNQAGWKRLVIFELDTQVVRVSTYIPGTMMTKEAGGEWTPPMTLPPVEILSGPAPGKKTSSQRTPPATGSGRIEGQ